MILNVSSKVDGPEFRAWACERLAAALGRFAHAVGRVQLHITDQNGPRGGVDKAARAIVLLRRGEPVVVHDLDADQRTLVHRVADRLAFAVTRAIKRRQDIAMG